MPRLTLLIAAAAVFAACPPASTVKPTADTAAQPAKGAVAQAPAETTPAEEDPAVRDADRLRKLPPLYFALDSAQLQPESQEVLNDAAQILRRRPGVKVRIEGHTCELGTAEYNLALGLRRAQVVRDYLARLGVPGGALETISFGEEQPADEGRSDEAHRLNRRSELRISLDSHAAVQR